MHAIEILGRLVGRVVLQAVSMGPEPGRGGTANLAIWEVGGAAFRN